MASFVRKDFSKATGGTGQCPKCGSASFRAKRSLAGKTVGFATVGLGAVLVPKTRVKCQGCGQVYDRN